MSRRVYKVNAYQSVALSPDWSLILLAYFFCLIVDLCSYVKIVIDFMYKQNKQRNDVCIDDLLRWGSGRKEADAVEISFLKFDTTNYLLVKIICLSMPRVSAWTKMYITLFWQKLCKSVFLIRFELQKARPEPIRVK